MEGQMNMLYLILVQFVLVGSLLTNGVASLCINVKKMDLCRESTLTMPKVYGKCGEEVQAHWAHNMPNVKFFQARTSAKYLLIMVDADAPNAENPSMAYWRHWVVSDIPGSALLHGDLTGVGNTLTEYAGPSPPKGSHLHRYQLILFRQTAPLDLSETFDDAESRGHFDLEGFLKSLGLCQAPVASFQYTARHPSEVLDIELL